MSKVALDCSIKVAGLVGSRDWSTAADPSWNKIICVHPAREFRGRLKLEGWLVLFHPEEGAVSGVKQVG